ncbi:hypothetical protein LJC23_04435 [Desulfovibrio sp. OttesenSCG-928-I05]|nr:hypothetical protein [Desulfovibrio sp. OttesenSCG-928-I05]
MNFIGYITTMAAGIRSAMVLVVATGISPATAAPFTGQATGYQKVILEQTQQRNESLRDNSAPAPAAAKDEEKSTGMAPNPHEDAEALINTENPLMEGRK